MCGHTEGCVGSCADDQEVSPYLAADASDVTDLEQVLVFREPPMYLAINKNTDPNILSALQDSYQKLVNSGDLETISRSYGF